MKKKTVALTSIAIILASIAFFSMKPESVQATAETKLDKATLAFDGITLDVPTHAAIIDQQTAIQSAKNSFGDLVNSATDVQVEYHLITNPHFELFSQVALAKNPDLKAKRHMEKTPAYIVTFSGTSVMGSQQKVSNHPAPMHHVINVVVDANSGETLMAFSDN